MTDITFLDAGLLILCTAGIFICGYGCGYFFGMDDK